MSRKGAIEYISYAGAVGYGTAAVGYVRSYQDRMARHGPGYGQTRCLVVAAQLAQVRGELLWSLNWVHFRRGSHYKLYIESGRFKLKLEWCRIKLKLCKRRHAAVALRHHIGVSKVCPSDRL